MEQVIIKVQSNQSQIYSQQQFNHFKINFFYLQIPDIYFLVSNQKIIIKLFRATFLGTEIGKCQNLTFLQLNLYYNDITNYGYSTLGLQIAVCNNLANLTLMLKQMLPLLNTSKEIKKVNQTLLKIIQLKVEKSLVVCLFEGIYKFNAQQTILSAMSINKYQAFQIQCQTQIQNKAKMKLQIKELCSLQMGQKYQQAYQIQVSVQHSTQLILKVEVKHHKILEK
ncbi:hypothetical protein TTHERM_000182182 (macronuclear) [Tetrahymena thermophila SB210]|uniref:Uncharacterized protein n=1 Tax=Tetrahymena thermophila (strain SB210) TaxID=312017 RepID=W7XGQ4_TETTS|nr:hypothetical protein TTHERM_000182182 [Tetrahymena thermophila SB210]EWS76223.1 hypothetical protein TTHERM_000182182 [Tetrahymena thermophila SB210]|eukprot:XP_012651270.1 hypothetical protein TTHERM_000182182 [Tetrahymena thermophila SB210]